MRSVEAETVIPVVEAQEPPPEPAEPVPEPEPAPVVVPPPAPVPAASEEPVSSFEIRLQKTGAPQGRYGLDLDYWKSCVQIVGIPPGAVQAYNESALAGRKVAPHDLIVGVNSKTAVSEMKSLLHQEKEVNLQIKKPMRQTAKVQMEGASDPLGLRLLHQQATSTCILVVEVMPGVFQKYNQGVSSDKQVRDGDLIEAVNGVSGSAVKMFEEFKRARSIEVVFLRLP